MSFIKISVIICGFNEEKFLARCMQSLLNQTLQEMEIILVDDASTDNTLKLMLEYESQHPQKIRVIHNEQNLLLGGSRNRGLEIAKGEYIAFCDCDDWVDAEMYETMYSEATKENSDICYCLLKKEFENSKSKIYNRPYFIPLGKINIQQKREIIINNVAIIPCHIFKKTLFIDNNIRFPEHIRYEDIPVSALIIPYISSITKVDKDFYHYFIHSGTITTTKNDKKYLDKQQACNFFIDEYKKRNFYETYKNEVNYLFFRKGYIHPALNYIVNSKRPIKQNIVILKNNLLEIDKNYRKNKYYKQRKSFVVIDVMLDYSLLIKLLKLVCRILKYNI